MRSPKLFFGTELDDVFLADMAKRYGFGLVL